MKIFFVILLASQLLLTTSAYAKECQLPHRWQKLCHNLRSHVTQKNPKMRLEVNDAQELQGFLESTEYDLSELLKLQASLPKTTTELLIAIYKRDLSAKEAELIAQYLSSLIHAFQFQN